MLSFTGALKVYVALEPQDMRKSFNGLAAVVEQYLIARSVPDFAPFMFRLLESP